MERFWRLARIQFRVTWGLSAWKKGRPFARYAMLLLPLAFLPILSGIFIGASWFFRQTAGTPYQSALLALLFASTQLITLVVSLPYIISVFYLNDDVNVLLPLPIAPWQLVASKFMVVWSSEWLFTLGLALPVIVAWLLYGPATSILSLVGQGLLLLLLTAVLPILPVAVGAVLAIGFMQLVSPSRGRFKEYMQVGAGVIGLAVGLGINLMSQRLAHGNPQQFIQQLTAPGGLASLLSRIFPPSQWAVWVVAPTHPGQSWIGGALLVSVSAAAVLLVGWLAQRWYLSGLLGQTSRRRQALLAGAAGTDATTGAAGRAGVAGNAVGKAARRATDWRAQLRVRSVGQALWSKEWLMFWRTPGFAVQGLLLSLAMPLSMVVIGLASSNKGLADLRTALGQFRSPAGSALPWAAFLAGGLALVASFNPMLSVGFSREGRQAWNGLILPLRPGYSAGAKLLVAAALSTITMVLYTALVAWLLHPPVLILLAGLLWAAAIATGGYALGLAIDYSLPKLDWKNPMEVAQNSLGGFLATFGALAPVLVLGALALVVWIKLTLRGPLFYGTLVAATLVIDAIAVWLLTRAAARRYQVGV